MLYEAKNDAIALDGAQMDYIRFGTGKRNLVILPGLGDGLRTVKGTALPMSLMYRLFAKNFTVYAFSRKAPLPEGYTTRDMARDQAEVMDRLGIGRADILAVSMGGMIAQWLAADYPDKVGKLVLTVTCARPNAILRESVEEWTGLAEREDHTAFMRSNLLRIYSDGYCRKNLWTAPILGKLMKPASYDRFFIQAKACLTHDAFDSLGKISAPTLVIGGEQDKALGGEASRELASSIPRSVLRMYPEWGHGLYEEAKDFNDTVLHWLMT